MKITTLAFGFLLSAFAFGQSQIGNSNLESWSNVGAPTEEPNNWNGFKTGIGTFSGFANKQLERSTSIRPGATGMYCARIWSTSVLGITANGTMTCGRINMGSSTPANAANYNYSIIADTNFSEPCMSVPDSIVFWAKYTQAGSGNQQARIHAIVHDAYDTRDPIDANSQPHVLGDAVLNFSPTNGTWARFSTPFTMSANMGLTPEFILVTFATNSVPGGGAANDEVLIDDIELIYNSGAGINEVKTPSFLVNYENGMLQVFGGVQGELTVINLQGQQVFVGKVTSPLTLNLNSGVYIAQIKGQNGLISAQKFIVK